MNFISGELYNVHIILQKQTIKNLKNDIQLLEKRFFRSMYYSNT